MTNICVHWRCLVNTVAKAKSTSDVETVLIRKAQAVHFLWPVAVIAGVIVDYPPTKNYIRSPLNTPTHPPP